MTPAELMQQFGDVIAMVDHAEVAFDDGRDPLRGPQVRPVAVGERALGEESDQADLLSRGQPRGTPRTRLGLQRVRAAASPRVAPAQHAARMTPEASPDLVQGQAVFQ